MNPEISVIIPALNEKDTIGNVIRFLRDHQEGFVHEIIVADGGSTDGTVSEAEKAGADRIVQSPKGRARQMNAGAKVASGDLLWFLHADTFPPPRFDAMIVRAARRGADFGCFTLRFDDPHPLLRFYAGFTRFRTMLMRFGDQSLFVKTSLFKKAGGFQ
jgi:glycosyltransferase involved in cell wall biosynthesis